MKLDAVVRVTTLDKGASQLAVVQVRDGCTGAIVDDATWKASNGKALAQMLSKQMKPRFQRSLGGPRPRPGSLQPVPPEAEWPPWPPRPLRPGACCCRRAGRTARRRCGGRGHACRLPTGAAPPLPVSSSTTAARPGGGRNGEHQLEQQARERETGPRRRGRRGDVQPELLLQPGHQPGAPGVLAGHGIAPAAKVTWAPLFGQRGYFTGHIAMSVGLKSTATDGTTYPSQMLDWGAGLGYRFLIGEKSHVGLEVGYEHQGFTISGTASNPRPDIPDVGYSAVAAGRGSPLLALRAGVAAGRRLLPVPLLGRGDRHRRLVPPPVVDGRLGPPRLRRDAGERVRDPRRGRLSALRLHLQSPSLAIPTSPAGPPTPISAAGCCSAGCSESARPARPGSAVGERGGIQPERVPAGPSGMEKRSWTPAVDPGHGQRLPLAAPCGHTPRRRRSPACRPPARCPSPGPRPVTPRSPSTTAARPRTG